MSRQSSWHRNDTRRSLLLSLLGLTARAYASPIFSTVDTHHHIYESRFPPDSKATLRPGNAAVADYRLLQTRLGIARHIVVQPSTYGVDNSCLLDALRQFGRGTARGIAVVNTAVSDTELKRLDAAGVCGLRFNLVQAGATTPEMIQPLSTRIAAFGWHIQINASAEQILAAAEMWNRVPVPIVFDHFGHVTKSRQPSFALLCKLMQRAKAWVKLSGAETISKSGDPSYGDVMPVAQAFIREAPDQLLWGSNWPHPTSAAKPDDAQLFNLLSRWVPTESTRRKILVDNPVRLFGFS